MAEVASLQLQKNHQKERNAIAARNREKRMRNLNITYTKSRKRRRTVNNNSRCSSAANASLEEGRSSPIVARTVYQCPYCSFWHQTMDGFHGHLTKNHQQGDHMYQCTYCHLTADSRRDIWNHIHRLSETESIHKRATCLVRSENLIERYAVYLKTVQVPASAKCGQLSQNSISVNDSFHREAIKNIESTPDAEHFSSSETDEDILTFNGSPISVFADVTIPLVDCMRYNSSPGLQRVKVELTADKDFIGSLPKKRRIDGNLKTDLRISNKSEINCTSNTLLGIRRISKQADSESEKDTFQSNDDVLKISKQDHRQSIENVFQTNSSCSSRSDVTNGDSDLDTVAPSSSSSSEYSDWTNETEENLEPPRFTRASVSKPRFQPIRNSDKKPIRACDVLFSLTPRRLPFYPQIGDEVVYFRQGHELYLDIVKQKKLYKFNPRSLPWYSQSIDEQEFVKIIGIKYEVKPPMVYCLKLACMDPTTRALTGKSFIVKYHDIEEVLDFLVLQQDYDSAIQRTWQPGDCFRSVVSNARGVQVWWEGLIEEREPLSSQYPDSPFLCYRIRWKNNKLDRASPWDLEKIDPNRRTTTNHDTGVGTLPHEISNLLYKPLSEEWPPIGDRDTECDRISAGFNKVMDMYVAKHFLAPVNLELYPTYASIVKYPMDLSTIKARLESRFYRRLSAVQYDIRRIYINAFKFNLPTSDIVRNSSIVSDLCLEITRNRDSNDVKALYQQVFEKYRIRDEKEEKAAEQIRNAEKVKTVDVPKPKKSKPTALVTTAATCWKQQCKDVLEILEQSEDAVLFSELSKIQDEPDYLRVMDYPMDLETVREELRLNNYATPTDFARDVRVIFENSKSYFTNKKSRNWCMTARLSAVFEENISNILASVKQPDESSIQSVSSSSSDNNNSRKRANSASTNESLQEVGNTRESNQITSHHTAKEPVVVEASSSAQLTDANENISVCNTSVIAGVDGVNEPDTEIPDTSFKRGNLVERKTPLLSQKEQLDIDIENGYRNLETIKADMQKDIQLLSEQQEKINAYYATLLEHDEEGKVSDSKASKISKLTSLSALREKINGQLVHCIKQKLTQELAWREHQATALKLELRLNLLDPCKNALEFKTVEKMLTEKRNHEIQSEGELNLTKSEIVALEQEQRDVDRQITDLKAMQDKLTEMEAMKTAIELQILNKKSRENDLIEDLSKRINAWKTLEMKLIQILYEEAVGDIEKIAKEKFNKLNQLVEGSFKR